MKEKMNKREGYLPLIPFFKGIAILMIILVHSSQKVGLTEVQRLAPRFGQMGCQIFFVLSAFSLCLSLERKKQSYGSFLLKRIGKIWPSWILIIILYIILGLCSILIFDRNVLNSSLKPLDIIFNVLLLNGLIPTAANNLVVRGGWFVGTIMILYIITPLLFKIFNFKFKWWEKSRAYLFPIIIICGACSFSVLLGAYDARFQIYNNNFWYFFVINQVGPYSLGFTLFELYRTGKIKSVRIPIVKMIIPFVCSIILFYLDIRHAFVFVPTLFSIAFLYAYISVDKYCNVEKMTENKLTKILSAYGKQSFSIYLTHSFIVYEGVILVRKVCGMLSINLAPIILYIILLPIIYIVTYYVGKLFTFIMDKIIYVCKKIVTRKEKKENGNEN